VKHVHEIELALEPDNRSTDHAATALRLRQRLLTDQRAGETSLPLFWRQSWSLGSPRTSTCVRGT